MNNQMTKKPLVSLEDAEFRFDNAKERQPSAEADHLYTMLKPLHNLPRGKNTWNPSFLKKWWFWPASLAALVILHNFYPMLMRLLFGPNW